MIKTDQDIAPEFMIQGRLLRIAKLRNEGYDFVDDPHAFGRRLHDTPERIDLFTFTQNIADPEPKYEFRMQMDSLAVLSLTDYNQWWTKVLNDKTRNMVRKAGKKGVELRPFEMSESAAQAIKSIYDESPWRQQRRFKHYGKPVETIHRDHATYLDRSDFVGAYWEGQMVGFIKLVHQPGWSSLMQIFSMLAHRDKAPTNALIAKAVAICTEKSVPRLQYGSWSRRSMGDFKLHHGFEPFSVPRYHVPLSALGRAALATGMNEPLTARIPERYVDRLAAWRGSWNSWRQSRHAGTRA